MAEETERAGRVFISSTCYDLIDLRAALHHTLSEAGLSPVLSDRPGSDFKDDGSASSIESCLANVRASERCIVVLSQRYGPPLERFGYGPISATHLEYREARALRIPVTFYVRDQLVGEYQLWRKNPGLKPAWAKGEDAEQLFGMIDEHRKLEEPSKPNCVWPFTTANDLCQRVLVDLGATAVAARLRRLAEMGRLPLLSVTCGATPGPNRSACLRNSGQVAALGVRVRQPDGGAVMDQIDLAPGAFQNFQFHCTFTPFSFKGGYGPALEVEYELGTGEKLCDTFALLVTGVDILSCAPAGRRFTGESARLGAPEVVRDRGHVLVKLDRLISASEDAARANR